ncbi:MAG: metallophosphoesterase [Polyangiaceae bacterium]|nr:metallophosphoesterase [Polyangiaceae bacterium]
MHTLWLIARYGMVPLALGSVAHYVAWRWLRRSFPSTVERHRRWLVPLLAILAASVLVRLGSSFFAIDGVPWLVGAIMIWHLTVGALAIGVSLAHATERTWKRFRPGAKHHPPLAHTPLPRRRLLEGATGLVLLSGSGAALGRGFLSTRFDVEIVRLSLKIPKLPRTLDGFSLVQLSDLHVGTYFQGEHLAHAIELARRLVADLYVVTGDIVDLNSVYAPRAGRALSALKARHGVIAVLGNHDYYAGADAVLDGLRSAGVEVLVNASKRISPGLVVAGLDDVAGAHREGGGSGPDVEAALRDVEANDVAVMLAHQPHLFEETAGRIDLQLSGHTHGGQIRVGFAPIGLLYPYVSGRYERAGATLWVNRGLGVGGAPTRIGARPELTHIVLRSG